MIVVPHLPYLPDLAPFDFALFPKLKIKLKAQRFESVVTSKGNHKRYLTSLRKMTSTVFMKREKK
jgi:hypothetical protein